MKIALVSDIHANLPAMKEVMKHIDKQDFNTKVCLGDIVGYCASPNECIDIVVQNFNYIVAGNHDSATTNEDEVLGFTPIAKEAMYWTQKQVTEENKDILKNLDYGHLIENEILFIHGSPRAPFAYMSNDTEALNSFINPIENFNIAFVGHTHVPGTWQLMSNGHLAYMQTRFNSDFNKTSEYSIVLDKDSRYIINIGSVGQPRDNDPRACYATYDTESRLLTYYRIPYPIDIATSRMMRAGFQMNAVTRLIYGK